MRVWHFSAARSLLAPEDHGFSRAKGSKTRACSPVVIGNPDRKSGFRHVTDWTRILTRPHL
jgi:hypothetical protein